MRCWGRRCGAWWKRINRCGVLFGSAAQGDGGADSDYDLMIVVADEAPAELTDSKTGYRALRGLGMAKDIVVWSRTSSTSE